MTTVNRQFLLSYISSFRMFCNGFKHAWTLLPIFALHCAWPRHPRVPEEFIRSRLKLWVSYKWNETQVHGLMIKEQSQVLQVPFFLVGWWAVWWDGAWEKWRMHGKGPTGEVPWTFHLSCSPSPGYTRLGMAESQERGTRAWKWGSVWAVSSNYPGSLHWAVQPDLTS